MAGAKIALSGSPPGEPAERGEGSWIHVKDRLPKLGVKVLACGMPSWPTDKRICFDMRNDGGQWVSGWKITHWMPLPDLPEEYRREEDA